MADVNFLYYSSNLKTLRLDQRVFKFKQNYSHVRFR
ncbi:MAG: hypothetical protein UV58_C0016G0003 [Candidatus Wolfebacteria bacterium GW2011_GWC1_43_10]|uniref:Uncharacterized protein n=1 Tax=Candidatus Wolfebacteria bacterium GW2011_GWC1_43_10 TaxID=1619011 RepID=A0A0G1C8A4_9BACT|nr:MAG: hypothetical protein UV58_C0016G0003 [Candidatus Wolfebacteria bacterium GW2011_GWC1_43_10]KKT22955.1 MAG: hypothetical protein UW08_C0002G0084 [Parcubacteria group bacterium GW2011_GWB1_43_8b]